MSIHSPRVRNRRNILAFKLTPGGQHDKASKAAVCVMV
jgi:hypothetical protein